MSEDDISKGDGFVRQAGDMQRYNSTGVRHVRRVGTGIWCSLDMADHDLTTGRGRARRAVLRAAAAFALLLLAGCAWLRPAPAEADLDTPLLLLNEGQAATASWPDPAWWRAFGSPELDRLMADATARNLTIAAAVAQLEQADAQLRIAGAGLLPSLDLSYNRQRQQVTSATGSDTTRTGRSPTRVFNANQLTFNGSYEIDFWGKNRASLEAARQSRLVGAFNLGTVTITSQASVASTYFALLAAQEQLAILEENIGVAGRVLGVLRARQAAGTSTGLDVAQQETLLAQLRAQLPPMQQAVEVNRNALAVLAGRAPAASRAAGGGFSDLTVPAPGPGLTTEVLTRRPDVHAAESALAAANADIAVARAQLLPSVVLSGDIGWTALTSAALISPQTLIFTLAAGLAQPLFKGGALVGNVQLSEARARELLANYRLAILSALQDTDDAAIALRQTGLQEAQQQDAVRTAERAYAISEAQFRAGTIDLLTLLITQTTLFNARNLLVSARLARLQAAVGMFRALGGGWTLPT